MSDEQKRRDEEAARIFVREGGACVMDTYRDHEDTFLAGIAHCRGTHLKPNEAMTIENVYQTNVKLREQLRVAVEGIMEMANTNDESIVNLVCLRGMARGLLQKLETIGGGG